MVLCGTEESVSSYTHLACSISASLSLVGPSGSRLWREIVQPQALCGCPVLEIGLLCCCSDQQHTGILCCWPRLQAEQLGATAEP